MSGHIGARRLSKNLRSS